MTFRHVFWEDALEIDHVRSLLRLVFLMFFVPGSVLLTDELVTSSSNYLFCIGLFFFSIFLSVYINAALQGLQLTAEWANEGGRDGRYWTEHLLISSVIFFSLHAFLYLTFNQDIFEVNGSFTESQLLLELPLTFLIFCSMMLLICYVSFLIVYLVGTIILRVNNRQNEKDLFAQEKHKLFCVWQSLSASEKRYVHPKIVLVEKALYLFHQLPRYEQKKQHWRITELFESAINECLNNTKHKNPLQ